MLKRITIFVVLCCTFAACEKDSIVYIDGNVAPPDSTVESVTLTNYLNKVYISLLGRKASDQEFDEGLSLLQASNANYSSRSSLVETVMSKEEYFHNEYETIRADVLNNADTADFTTFKTIFTDSKKTTNDQILIDWYDFAIHRLSLLQDVIPDLESGSIDFTEVQKRCVYNNFYDDINMGTENFVVSIYQNFVFRYPTVSELENAKKMVDGGESIVFFTAGKSKEDFLDIFFSSNEYYEGQVRTNYKRFMYREPTSEELILATKSYKVNNDFKLMQKAIFVTDEYFGL